MRKRYSRSYTVLSFLTMFSYRELPFGLLFFYIRVTAKKQGRTSAAKKKMPAAHEKRGNL